MIEISKKISVDGFETKEEFNKWLEEQEKIEPNESVLKTFKYFLMKIDEADKNEKADLKRCESLEKYANKVIERKLMNEDKVIQYILQAQGLHRITEN